MALVNGREDAHGIGDGFSAFLGLSKINYMWIASLSPGNNIVDEKWIQFNQGDLLILPFGTIHAGDKNRTPGVHSYKLFTEVYTTEAPNSRSQLWIVDGKGFTSTKQKFQLGIDRCLVPQDQDPVSSSKKRNYLLINPI
jgi:hypothetical protein